MSDIATTSFISSPGERAPLPFRLARGCARAADRVPGLSGGHPVRDDHLDEPQDRASGRAGIPQPLRSRSPIMCAPSAAPRSGARPGTRSRSRCAATLLAFVMGAFIAWVVERTNTPLAAPHRLHADRAHRDPGHPDRDLLDPDREPEHRPVQSARAAAHRRAQRRQHLQLLGHGLGAGAGDGAADLSCCSRPPSRPWTRGWKKPPP